MKLYLKTSNILSTSINPTVDADESEDENKENVEEQIKVSNKKNSDNNKKKANDHDYEKIDSVETKNDLDIDRNETNLMEFETQ